MQYLLPWSLARSNFFQNNMSKQKSFHLLSRELQDKCSASISVEIICFEHLQQGFYEKLNHGTYLQEYLRPCWLEDDYCVPFFKLKFLVPTLRYHVLFAKAFNYVWRKLKNKLEKYAFLWFRKRDFYF